jgi:hypothetical protein
LLSLVAESSSCSDEFWAEEDETQVKLLCEHVNAIRMKNQFLPRKLFRDDTRVRCGRR